VISCKVQGFLGRGCGGKGKCLGMVQGEILRHPTNDRGTGILPGAEPKQHQGSARRLMVIPSSLKEQSRIQEAGGGWEWRTHVPG
jgi:hypothetical protein